MQPTAITISLLEDASKLPTCSPFLMPFHIDYTGPAPISTYLHVEAADEIVGAPNAAPDASTVVEGVGNVSTGDENTDDAAMKVDAPVPESAAPEAIAEPSLFESEPLSSLLVVTEDQSKPLPQSQPLLSKPSISRRITDATTRFISAFRGRTIQGLKVDLPEGYVGLVLRGDGDSSGSWKPIDKGKGKGKVKAKPATKTKGRTTRSSKVIDADVEEVERIDKDDHMIEDGEQPQDDLQDDIPTQTLVPTSQFSSFVLWHADMPVDEGRDEYFRTLTEWTRLAHEIHRVED